MGNILELLLQLESLVEKFGTAFVWLILSLPFLAVFLILVIPFLIRGYKQGLYQALISLGCSVVAALGSVVLSQGLGMLLSMLLFKVGLGAISSKVPEEYATIVRSLADGTYLGSLAQWLFSAILAVVLFVVLFIVLLAVCKIAIGSAAASRLKKCKQPVFSKGGGLIIRIVDTVLVAFLFAAPLYAGIHANINTMESAALGTLDALDLETETVAPYEEETPLSATILKFTTPVKSYPLVKVASVPGLDFGTRVFGSFICNGKLYNAYDIFEQGSDVFVLTLSLKDKKMAEYGQSEVDVLRDVVETANKNNFFYGIFSDAFRLAAKVVPEQAEGDGSSKAGITAMMLQPFEECTAADVKDCANSIVDIFESAVNNKILGKINDPRLLFETLSDDDFLNEAIPMLRRSKLLSKTVDNILLISLDYMNFSSESNNDPQFDERIESLKKRIELSVEAGTTDPQKEIYAFKTLFNGFAELHRSTDGFKTFNFESISSKGIADLLSGLGSHPHIGKQGAEDLIRAALPSFGAEATILTDDFIEAAIKALSSDIDTPPAKGAQGKFENLIATAQNLTSAITNGFGDTQNREKLSQTIDTLLSDMTPESAEAVSTVLTKDVMNSLNDKGSSSGDTEVFVKDLISNMAEYDAPDKASLEREREAIIKMNDLVLDVDNKLNNKAEGESALTAAVGGDLKSFVNDVSSSVVMMDTINDSFEDHPDKDTDPRGMFSAMGDEDKAELSSVCAEMMNDDAISAAQKENIKQLCLFMGGSVN